MKFSSVLLGIILILSETFKICYPEGNLKFSFWEFIRDCSKAEIAFNSSALHWSKRQTCLSFEIAFRHTFSPECLQSTDLRMHYNLIKDQSSSVFMTALAKSWTTKHLFTMYSHYTSESDYGHPHSDCFTNILGSWP